MRLSRYFLPVLKENPAEAQIVSHRYMLRAGMIKQQAAGEAEKLGAVGMAKLVYEEGGAAAFFRGSGERVLYWAPAIGIFLTAYCRIRHALL